MAVAQPQRMVGIVRQRRAKDLGNFRPFAQPAGNGDGAFLVLREPCAKGADAALHEVGIVGAHRHAEGVGRGG
ncbi:hypothetical protein D3C72_2346670 [compost metagenome]